MIGKSNLDPLWAVLKVSFSRKRKFVLLMYDYKYIVHISTILL